jgi:hypothetical protein
VDPRCPHRWRRPIRSGRGGLPRGVPTMVLEMFDSLASTWCHRTYDRLTLHLPRRFCELPLLPFPEDYWTTCGPSAVVLDLGLTGSDLGSFFYFNEMIFGVGRPK